MKKILIPVSIVAILLCASWKEDAKTVSPIVCFWRTVESPCL